MATPAAVPVAAAVVAAAAPVSVTQSLQSSMASVGLRGTENFDLSVQVLTFFFIVLFQTCSCGLCFTNFIC
jgi:hypothetical protein